MAVANGNANVAALPSVPPLIARAIQQQLRSGQSNQQSHVCFVNTTDRIVNLYWLNYQGVATFYLNLTPTTSAKMNTFCAHPWIFRDRNSGERMHVMHSPVFWPQPYQAPDPRNRGKWIPCRKEIYIHLPLRTLRETCLWNVVKCIVQDTRTIEQLARPRPGEGWSSSEDTDEDAISLGGGDKINCEAAAIQAIEHLGLPNTIKTDLKQLMYTMTKHRYATR